MKTKRGLSCAVAVLCFCQAGFGATYEQNLEKSYVVTPGGKLVIQADLGAIAIVTDDNNQVQVTVLRKIKGGTKAQADELFADQEVRFAQDGNTISVTAKRKSQKSWSWRPGKPNLEVRYQARVPRKFDVDLRTSGGDIVVGPLEGRASVRTSSGMIKLDKVGGEVEASDSGGNITIAEAAGKLAARTSSGSIMVQKIGGRAELSNSGGNIKADEAEGDIMAITSSGSISLGTVVGDVKARNSGGDISLKSAGGNADLETSSGTIRVGAVQGKELAARNSGGSIRIEKAGGQVNARTSSGSLQVGSVTGALTAKNSGGHISVDTAQSTVSAQTSSGAIKIKTATGNLDLHNSGGDVNVDTAGGAIAARTSSGSIRIGSAQGKIVAHNSGGSIKIGEAHGQVEAVTSSGEISVAFAQPPKADSRLEVSGGGINVALSPDAAINVDARSSGGQVLSELALTITVQGGQKSGTLQGQMNGGGPSLFLRASSGDIRLKKSTASESKPEAEAPEK